MVRRNSEPSIFPVVILSLVSLAVIVWMSFAFVSPWFDRQKCTGTAAGTIIRVWNETKKVYGTRSGSHTVPLTNGTCRFEAGGITWFHEFQIPRTSSLSEGQAAAVRYDPADPSHCYVERLEHLDYAPLIIGLLSVSLFIGIARYEYRRVRARTSEPG